MGFCFFSINCTPNARSQTISALKDDLNKLPLPRYFHIQYPLFPSQCRPLYRLWSGHALSKRMITSPRQPQEPSSGATDRYRRASRRKAEYYSHISIHEISRKPGYSPQGNAQPPNSLRLQTNRLGRSDPRVVVDLPADGGNVTVQVRRECISRCILVSQLSQ